jgi:trehalose 6-phosphate phosphatase
MQTASQLLSLCKSAPKVLLALDRDGTLLPLEPDPDKSIMPVETRALLNQLALLPDVQIAIVSARGNNRLLQDALSNSIILAGIYGIELRWHDGSEWVAPEAQKAMPELRRLIEEVKLLVKDYAGTFIEDDYYAFCFHCNMVDSEQKLVLETLLRQMTANLEMTEMCQIPVGYEFMPILAWDKGHALERIAAHSHLSDPIPYCVYIGDAKSDEPAFDWVNKRGGASVLVGDTRASSKAQFRLEAPEQVVDFLSQLLKELAG